MVTLIIFLIDQVFLITLPDGDSQKTLTAPKGTRSDEYLPEQYGHQDIEDSDEAKYFVTSQSGSYCCTQSWQSLFQHLPAIQHVSNMILHRDHLSISISFYVFTIYNCNNTKELTFTSPLADVSMYRCPG